MKKTKDIGIGRGPLLLAIIIVGVAFSHTPLAQYLTRLGMDFTLPYVVQGDRQATDVVMVVIDEVTHRTPPFTETPEVAWTPFLGDVIQAVDQAGAAAIGLDMIYPKTLSGPDLLPGYDRPFISALFSVGRAGRLVLGETRLSDQTISPYQGQVLAVGGRKNVSPLQLTPDGDGIVRSYPSHFTQDDGSRVLSFANELVARAGKPTRDTAFLLDYVTPLALPAYRLSDLRTCFAEGKELGDRFRDKIVLIGVTLDVEDRHIASNRFVEENQTKATALDCAAPVVTGAARIHRQSVPGVSIHARAVQTILAGQSPQLLTAPSTYFITGVFLLLLGGLYLRIPPVGGFVLLGIVLALLWYAAILQLAQFKVLPYIPWAICAVLSYILLYTYRVFFENKEKRWIRHAFRHYLSPALVDQLTEDPSLLKLGGERRHVAVLFLDLAGFTKASEILADKPELLVAELNRYLAEMANIIEAHGGYVDKFIGDAVMGIWGAPVMTENPEDAAAKAALACQQAMVSMNKRRANPYIQGMRIGLNAGEAVVGNMGSEQRFNYTAVGDPVNLAARLESANKNYGTTILAGEDFVAHLSGDVQRREIDFVKVQGREAPVHIYEITGVGDGDEGARTPRIVASFAAARAHYLAQNFETAEAEFVKLVQADHAAEIYIERCRAYRANPPGPAWDGSHQLETK